MNPDKPIHDPQDVPQKTPITARQSRSEKAIVALLEYGSVARAAQEAGMHPSTLWRWMKQPDFQRKLSQAGYSVYTQALGRIHHGSNAAVAVLFRMLAEANPSTKLQAAKFLLESSRKGAEFQKMTELEQRLHTLEKSQRDSSAAEET